MGFPCRHSTSKAPSQPASLLTRPDQPGYLRSSGSSPPLPVISPLTASPCESRSAHSSAAAAGPMLRSWPPDWSPAAGAGSGSGSAAIATSAAIFGSAPSLVQPACSRTLTNLRFARAPACSASSPNSAASCVQATITSESPSALWNAGASLRHSWSCTTSGVLDFKALASALASMPTVRLQLQTLSVLPSRLILLPFPLGLLCSFPLVGGFFLFLGEEHAARLIQRREQLRRNRLAAGPVARIRFERIGQVEMRIAEQLLQREAAQLFLHLRMHEAGKLRLRRQAFDRRQRRRGLFCLFNQYFALEARPPGKKSFLFVGHQARCFGSMNERGLMRFFGSGRQLLSTYAPTQAEISAGIATPSTEWPPSRQRPASSELAATCRRSALAAT